MVNIKDWNRKREERKEKEKKSTEKSKDLKNYRSLTKSYSETGGYLVYL